MSSAQVNIIEQSSFLTTDILQALGRDGVIILVVGASLLFILILCLIGLMCTYCKSTKSPKTEEDRRPRYGTIIPSVTQRASPKPYTVSSHAPLSTSGTRENDAVLSAASAGRESEGINNPSFEKHPQREDELKDIYATVNKNKKSAEANTSTEIQKNDTPIYL